MLSWCGDRAIGMFGFPIVFVSLQRIYIRWVNLDDWTVYLLWREFAIITDWCNWAKIILAFSVHTCIHNKYLINGITNIIMVRPRYQTYDGTLAMRENRVSIVDCSTFLSFHFQLLLTSLVHKVFDFFFSLLLFFNSKYWNFPDRYRFIRVIYLYQSLRPLAITNTDKAIFRLLTAENLSSSLYCMTKIGL